MRTIEATKKCFVSYLLGNVFVFAERENGKRVLLTFPAPYGSDGWCEWKLEDIQNYVNCFTKVVGEIWLKECKLPYNWNKENLRLLFSTLSTRDVCTLIRQLVNDVEPSVLCSFFLEYPEAFVWVNPDWERHCDLMFQFDEPQERPVTLLSKKCLTKGDVKCTLSWNNLY